ncbi:MAG: hypothetical protein HY002_09060 [Candidatus Rokubacteria bacterium]|nr:hypothetical protein [Candidatus Rokubacteria bacterium]
MADDWARTIAKKVEGRLADEAERAATLRKRYEDGVERFRKQVLDLVAAVNAHIETEASRIHTIVLDNGLSLAAAYRRIVTVEEGGAVPGVPACVGKVIVSKEDRKAATQPEPETVFITSAGTHTAFYRYVGKDLKMMGEPELKQLVEFFAS